MNLLIFFLLVTQTLAAAVAVPRVSSSSKACAKAWLFRDIGTFQMFDDNVCMDIVPEMLRRIKIYKTCKCELWSSLQCGEKSDQSGGLEANIEAPKDDVAWADFTMQQGVISYRCYHP